ncbi:MAG: WxL protein peptidoglycan domain-containing protein [Gaiellaceae bacterium]
MTTPTTRLAALLALVVLSLGVARTALAAEQPYSSFSIRPVSGSAGYFVLAGKRGGTLAASFRIVNTGTKVGTALVYAVDATTGATSGAVYLDRVRKRRGAGKWIRLPVKRVTLRPGEARIVRFQVRIPRRMRSGHHLGGIVAENLELTGGNTTSRRSGLRVRVRHLSIVAVQVNLPGRAVPKMTFHGVRVGVSSGYEVLYLGFRNAGDVLVRPRLTLQVRDARGRVVVRRAQNLDTFVPRTRIRYPSYLTGKPLRSGTYRLAGSLTYLGRVTRFRATFGISRAHIKELAKTRPEVAAEVASDTGQSTRIWALMGGALVAGLIVGGLAMWLRVPIRRRVRR